MGANGHALVHGRFTWARNAARHSSALRILCCSGTLYPTSQAHEASVRKRWRLVSQSIEDHRESSIRVRERGAAVIDSSPMTAKLLTLAAFAASCLTAQTKPV